MRQSKRNDKIHVHTHSTMTGLTRGPKSVEQIVQEASNFDHSRTYPLNIALRTAQNMLQQAADYERDGNLQDAYLFLYRHADFFFTHMSKHPDARKPQFKTQMQRVKDQVKADLSRMEALKPDINRQFDRYQDVARTRKQQRSDEPHSSQRHQPSLLNAEEHNHLALQLANRELSRRQGSTQDDAALVDDISHGIQNIGRRLEPYHTDDTSLSSTYHYPSVPPPRHSQPLSSLDTPLGPVVPSKSHPLSTIPPPVPSKPHVSPSPLLSDAYPSPSAPAIPPKQSLSTPTLLPKQSLSSPTLPPKQSSSTPGPSYQFQPAAYTENGTPLRTLFLPTSLRKSFVTLSSRNTSSNLETCGILCGTLISSALFISHLVIPDQTSTSDTCETTEQGETALFDYVDKNELMVCGWIHTHPSQTCFLSSRDLHTSVGYQVMLPESVAIVCAPSKTPDHGIFRLTDPPGKDVILNCHQPGLFHPHSVNNLYTDATRPGHVSELDGLQFSVIDLRISKK